MAKVDLIRAAIGDAELIHRMKYEAFLPIFEKYRDEETSPVKESIEKVIRQLSSEGSDYYLIRSGSETVGAVRAAFDGLIDGKRTYRISPLFVLPSCQNRGLGFAAVQALFALYPDADVWRLSTIKQEARNCHLYEKCGFVISRPEEIVNERMTIVFYQKEC